MRCFLIALACVFINAGCTSRCVVESTMLEENVEKITLKNSRIAISVLPRFSGIIAAFDYLPERRNLIPEFTYSIVSDDLLPDEIEFKATGGRELIWGSARFPNVPLTVEEKKTSSDRATVRMFNRYFQGQNLPAVKEVEVVPDSTMAKVRFTVTNPDEKPREVMLWKNLIPALGKNSRDTVVMPVKGGVTRAAGRGVSGFSRDFVFLENIASEMNVYTAPGRPWIARCSEESPGVLALRTRPEDVVADSRFYSYKRELLHTMEIIFSPVKIASKADYTWEIDYLFFPSLRGIRDIAGNFGVDRLDGEDATILEVESCAPAPAGKLKLNTVNPDESVTDIGEFQLPELNPGQIFRLELPALPPETILEGVMPCGANLRLTESTREVK